MALSVTQTLTGSDDDSSVNIAGVNAAVGTMAVVLIASDNSGTSGAAPVYTVTDSAGNTYTQRGTTGNRTSGSSNDGASQYMFTAPITTALSSGSITADAPGSPDLAVIVYIVTSDAGQPVFSSVGTAVTGFRTTHECTASVNVDAGQMIIGHAALEHNNAQSAVVGDSDTVNGSWSTITNVARATFFESDNACITSSAQFKVVTATGNQTWSCTTTFSKDSAANYLILDESSGIEVDPGVFTITGTAADLQPTLKILAANGTSYAVTGAAANTEFGREVVGATTAFTITGAAATVEKAYPLTADAGSIVISGADAALLYGAGDRLPTIGGVFTVSGAAAALQRDLVAKADIAFYFIDGTPASLEVVKEVAAVGGAFTITGGAANLERGREVVGDAGSYVITGAGATLNLLGALKVGADGAVFSISGTSATLTAPAPVGPAPEITANAPSYAYWLKQKNKRRKAPELPPPMKAEVRIDPAVLAQAEADRRREEMEMKKAEAIARVSAARQQFPPRRRVLR